MYRTLPDRPSVPLRSDPSRATVAPWACGAGVTGTEVPEVHRVERYGQVNYAIPVADGRYTVTLYFAETWFGPSKPTRGGEGSRLFDVYCNGTAA